MHHFDVHTQDGDQFIAPGGAGDDPDPALGHFQDIGQKLDQSSVGLTRHGRRADLDSDRPIRKQAQDAIAAGAWGETHGKNGLPLARLRPRILPHRCPTLTNKAG
jgi:hypothetical protein